jgi:hypothetical protein
VSRTNRRLIAPAVIGVSAAALAQFVPGVAVAAAHQASQHASNTDSGQKPDAAAGPSAIATPAVASPGCTESSSPDYGCGKITVEAQPVASTFPADAIPDVNGLTFDITGQISGSDMAYDGATTQCKTGDTNSTSSDECPESVWADAAGGPSEGGPWVAGAEYAVTLDTSVSSAPAPANTLIPPITGAFPDCTAYQKSNPTGASGCPDLTPVRVYGTYHQVGLDVINSLTHKGIAKATYELCAATVNAPTTGSAGCPSGSSVLATAATDSSGTLVFPGRYLGSPHYSFALTHARGYHPTGSQPLAVPVVTDVAQAGTLYQGSARLAPIKTTVTTHRVKTSKNKRVTFNALAGAKHVVGPLKIVKLSKPHHGKVRHSGGKISYKPRKDFVGKDVFTYTVRNGVGVTVTSKVVVHVKA